MTKKFIKNFIGLALLTTAMTYATNTTTYEIESKSLTEICHTEACMSTTKLQEEVEKLSLEGNLPFEMGLELIKRWSGNKIS